MLCPIIRVSDLNIDWPDGPGLPSTEVVGVGWAQVPSLVVLRAAARLPGATAFGLYVSRERHGRHPESSTRSGRRRFRPWAAIDALGRKDCVARAHAGTLRVAPGEVGAPIIDPRGAVCPTLCVSRGANPPGANNPSRCRPDAPQILLRGRVRDGPSLVPCRAPSHAALAGRQGAGRAGSRRESADRPHASSIRVQDCHTAPKPDRRCSPGFG